MELFKACFLMIFLSSPIFLGLAIGGASPLLPGTIERSIKQQILASLAPGVDPASSGQNQLLFLTSPSQKYSASLLRRETAIGAGGFGNDFCYIQVEDEGGNSVWESECASVSNVNTCILVFSDAGLEIFDGSRSSWDTGADGDNFQRLDLLDIGDMQIRDEEGNLVWKASDAPNINQNCGSVGSPELNPETPPFAKPIENNSPFGQQPQVGASNPQQQGGLLGTNNQQQVLSGDNNPQPGLLGDGNEQQQSVNVPFSGTSSNLNSNQPLGTSNQEGLVDNTPFDSGVSKNNLFDVCVALVCLFSVVAAF